MLHRHAIFRKSSRLSCNKTSLAKIEIVFNRNSECFLYKGKLLQALDDRTIQENFLSLSSFYFLFFAKNAETLITTCNSLKY